MGDVAGHATPTRKSPLAAYGSGATLEVRTATIVERPFRAMFNVRAHPDDARASEAMLEATGLAWPAPCRFVALNDHTLAWLGPDEFLLIDASAADASTIAPATPRNDSVRAALEGSVEALTAVGAGHTTLEIAGSGALELLSTGCALDLHPRAFRPGDCVATLFARTTVTLLNRGNVGEETPRVEMIVRRSYAEHVWRWLTAHG